MFIHPGNHLGDTWYFVENDIIHMFYLTCPNSVERHTAWAIAHAVSSDLIHWEKAGIILSRGTPDSYDGRCPATGSVLHFNNKYWLAYTGNWNGPIPTVAIAQSDDLFNWEKIPENPVTRIDKRFYAETIFPGNRNWLHWRDPFLFTIEQKVFHYVCAKRKDGWGTLGYAETTDMHHWKVLPPPEVEPVVAELECPQVYKYEKKYYLIFSSCTDFFSEFVQKKYKFPKNRWTCFSMVGESINGPFKMIEGGTVIPFDYPIQPYACQVVFFHKKPFLMGTIWNDLQDFITDPIPLQFCEFGLKVQE